jgi:predicted benzoate:H+ symporter BenE
MGIFSRFCQVDPQGNKTVYQVASGNVKAITRGESEHKLLNWMGVHHVAIGVTLMTTWARTRVPIMAAFISPAK